MTINKLKIIKIIPTNGLALFCGKVRPINGRDIEEICEIMEPPLPINKNSYYCDKIFHVELISDLFNIHKSIGYVIITSEEAILLKIRGSERTVVYKTKIDFANNTRRGGQSANRLARIRDEKKHNCENKIVEAICDKLCSRETRDIIICGNGNPPNIINEELKNSSLFFGNILGIVKINGNSSPIEESIENSKEILYRDEIESEKKEIDNIKTLICNDSDKCVFGLKDVLKCLKEDLIEKIICSDEINIKLFENKCDIKIIKHIDFMNHYKVIGILYYSGMATYILK